MSQIALGRMKESGFILIKPPTCNCDCAPYIHTHSSNNPEWVIDVDGEEIFDEL